MNIPYLYDAGALIAIDDGDRRIWARHRLTPDDGRDIHVPSVVVNRAWRDARRQVRLGKFLAGCHVVPVGRTSDPDDIHALVDTQAVKPAPVIRTV
ncbi:twitching motility protein PilT [Streptomyces poonensis]|uniref:Uncharacterized protein n=1 Tax=Streptomyces poonensis TaxID=68255 RepID=A0A918P8D9_9ACTN|nr:twitching motility protein PilT [Streptomyces poonensis]GGY90418.1 hypothetical protein GCM10010365_06020 [Streptomyces poonensis]GLJ87961.1 hypothetical protein GCM10017589_05610 [Streptomyces poonensis]